MANHMWRLCAMQVTELASLRRLTMDDVEMASLPLEGLSILEYLFLSRSGYLPDSLALPASLETLRINGVSTSSMVALHAAMRQATQLTCLLLQGISSLTGLPLELACLERLQDFGWEVSPELNDYGLRQLPAGPWLNSVTRLVLPASALPLSGLGPQLKRLGLQHFGSVDSPGQIRILRWAAQQPSLEQLSLGHSRRWEAPTAFALLEAGRCAPCLQVEGGDRVMSELFGHEP